MDPIANIEQQRELAHMISALDDRWDATGEPMTEDEQTEYLENAGRLASLVRALDEWRLAGGFDPYAPDLAERIKNIRLAITFHQAQLDNAPTLDEINQALGQLLSAGGH